LEVIELHDSIIESHTDEGREHMLGCGDQHAFLHQTGGVTDARYVAAHRLNLEAVEISAPEYDTCARWRRKYAHSNRSATMQTDTTTLHRSADCLLGGQGLTVR